MEGGAQVTEGILAAEKRSADRQRATLTHAGEAKGVDRPGPAADVDDPEIVESKGGSGPGGALGDDHLAGLGDLLEAGGDVEHVSGEHAQIELPGRRGEQITGVHPDAGGELHLEALSQVALHALEPAQDGLCGEQRPFWVVVVGCGEPEDAEDTVADERPD
jgi:hypothetical protein